VVDLLLGGAGRSSAVVVISVSQLVSDSLARSRRISRKVKTMSSTKRASDIVAATELELSERLAVDVHLQHVRGIGWPALRRDLHDIEDLERPDDGKDRTIARMGRSRGRLR
jgi:hypothetical protein